MLTHANIKATYFRLRCLQMRNKYLDHPHGYRPLTLSFTELNKKSIAPLAWFKFPSKMTCVNNSHLSGLGQRRCLFTSSTRTITNGKEKQGEDVSEGNNRSPWIISTTVGLAGALLFELRDSKDKMQAEESSAISQSENFSISTVAIADSLTIESPAKTQVEMQDTEKIVWNRRDVMKGAFADVVNFATKSVVGIRVTYSAEHDAFGSIISMNQGSGFIFRENGLIMTNAHVVQGQEKKAIDSIHVLLDDGRIVPGQLEIIDPGSDMAIIRISQRNLPALRLGNSDELLADELVVVVASRGVVNNFINAGIVMDVNFGCNTFNGDHNKNLFYIATITNLLHGQSGSPLMNMNGEVIGLNFSGFKELNIGVSVPINRLKKIINLFDARNAIQQSMGLTLASLDKHTAKKMEQLKISNFEILKSLCVVAKVRTWSSAHSSGLKEGDVIVKINEHKMPSNPLVVELLKSAQTFEIEVMRCRVNQWIKQKLTLRV